MWRDSWDQVGCCSHLLIVFREPGWASLPKGNHSHADRECCIFKVVANENIAKIGRATGLSNRAIVVPVSQANYWQSSAAELVSHPCVLFIAHPASAERFVVLEQLLGHRQSLMLK
jgi:hypothetical protein